MNDQAYCPSCGAARAAGAAFCSSCGTSFAQAPSAQQGLAGGLYEIEKMRAKLIPARILGILAGGATWWFVVGPMDNTILTLVALPVLLFGGMWVGQMIALSAMKR